MVYNVVCLSDITTNRGGAQGGVGLVLRDQPKGWRVESMRFHGPNVVICEIVAGVKRTQLISAYLPLSTLWHLPDLEEALTRFQEQDPIVLEKLNANTGQSQNP